MREALKETTLRQLIKNDLLNFLYTPSLKRMDQQFSIIAQSFSLDSKYQSLAFMYKGNIYYPEGYRPVRGQKIELLSRRLYAQMDEWILLHKGLNEEIQVTSDFISCLLTAAHNQADILDLLPDCLKPAIDIRDTHNSPPVLTPEEIQVFHKTHKEHIQTIKERIVLNMIT